MENQSVNLLSQCNAGISMALSAIDEVLPAAEDPHLRKTLHLSKAAHENLQARTRDLLRARHATGKEPNPMAKSMSWVKTNMKLAMKESDATIADLMTDGCNMGVKSLNKYLNQYKAADEVSKDIAKRLIHLEETLTADIRYYL